LRDNDETLLRVNSASLHDRFRANFARIISTLD